MKTPKQRERMLEHLDRRMAWLERRIRNYDGRSDSYDRAEFGALRWASTIARNAIDDDMVADLEETRT